MKLPPWLYLHIQALGADPSLEYEELILSIDKLLDEINYKDYARHYALDDAACILLTMKQRKEI
jgi:hypothetical protein